MTTISDFSEDMVEEILSRVPLTSLRKVRCTCKTWNSLSKIQIFGKETAGRKHVMGFMLLASRVFSLRFDLQGMVNEGDLVDPSIKQISKLGQTTISQVSQVSYVDGLLLCVDTKRLVVWNPYLGQTRRIRRPKRVFGEYDMFAFGYDNNRNHKILRIFKECEYNKGRGEDFPYSFEVYDFNSNSWRRVLDVKPEFYIYLNQCPVTLNGNTYFVALGIIREGEEEKTFLLGFDFTTERFGPLLPIPYKSDSHNVSLSCVREEKLAVLCQHEKTMEIWITTMVLPNAVSWSKFLKVDITSRFNHRSFFIDEEKKVAVAFYQYFEDKPTKNCCYQGAYIIGEDGYFKFMDLGEVLNYVSYQPPAFFSYVPSLVQL